jgi:tetratricopeptide (TPR) repeat protein
MRLLYIYILISLSVAVYAQDCSNKAIKTAKRHYKKSGNFVKKGIIAFDIAMCYKTKNDSLYRYWLWQTIEISKQGAHTKIMSEKIYQLYNTGFAYYELKNYKGSEVYFAKAIMANKRSSPPVLDSTVYLYYGISLFNNKHYADASDALTIYKKSQPSDTLTDSYLKECLKNK